MNNNKHIYAIGDIVKMRKTFRLEKYNELPVIVVGCTRVFGENEYKVVVCGHPNEFFFFLEQDIEGKY